MGKLDGKTALITGASSGIGEATALAFAAEGARVALAARRGDRLHALVERIGGPPGSAVAIEADVTDEGQVKRMVDTANAEMGTIDILVNNAGIMLLGAIDGADTEDWRRMININLLGLMYATHNVLPLMKARQSGHIVNISSLAGRMATAGGAVYNATKWGVGAFSEALRQEVHPHKLRVTLIEPAATRSELSDHITNAEARRASKERLAGFTILESEDVAAAIVYAVSQPPRVNVNEILVRPTEQLR